MLAVVWRLWPTWPRREQSSDRCCCRRSCRAFHNCIYPTSVAVSLAVVATMRSTIVAVSLAVIAMMRSTIVAVSLAVIAMMGCAADVTGLAKCSSKSGVVHEGCCLARPRPWSRQPHPAHTSGTQTASPCASHRVAVEDQQHCADDHCCLPALVCILAPQKPPPRDRKWSSKLSTEYYTVYFYQYIFRATAVKASVSTDQQIQHP